MRTSNLKISDTIVSGVLSLKTIIIFISYALSQDI
jgi:hypothetical protein